ncbi:MAG: hypothetical protein GY865_09840, partial [candidate division Zixibacteria bacterium]|nr:hypothetical protein [candidate division Zixibacteria bacterium]
MRVIKILSISAILLLSGINGFGQVLSFYERFDFLQASPSVFQEGALGVANPANLHYLKNQEYQLGLIIDEKNDNSFKNWSFAAASPGIGFGLIHRNLGGGSINSYFLSLAFGNEADAFGIGYSWHSSSNEDIGLEKQLVFSAISRSERIISISLTHRMSLESRWSETVGEVGFRPLGTKALTFFGDIAIKRGEELRDSPNSYGFIFEPEKGIHLIGRFFKNNSFTLSVNICLGNSSVRAQPHYNNNKATRYSFNLRYGGLRPSVIDEKINRNKKYIPMNLKGTIAYNKYVFFDGGTKRLMDILSDVRAAVDDPRISALVLNLSGMRIYPEHAWEIREEL